MKIRNSCRGLSVLEGVFLLAGLFVVLALMFPAGGCGPSALKAQAKNDVTQIATGILAYQAEYGKLPGTYSGLVGGKFLQALLGNDEQLNPRKIVFLEAATARKGRSGLSNGYFIDPWGGPYRITYGPDAGGQVIVGTNQIAVEKKVGVWNDPAAGTGGPKLTESQKMRRYVTSWD